MTILERAKAPTPKLFKSLRTIGLTLLAVSTTIITAPVAIPAVIIAVAGYVGVAGGVLSAISQITVDEEAIREEKIIHQLYNDNSGQDGFR